MGGIPALGWAKSSAFDYLSAINVPANLLPVSDKKVVVAIVDDGIRISHEDLKRFIWSNPLEISGNLIDDDGNARIDDLHGWDVADENGQVSPSDQRSGDFFHGTHLAGIVAAIVARAYGAQAEEYVSILPVKVLSDYAEDTSIRQGYRGIEYAVQVGADVILCAWGAAHISEKEEQILRQARNKGVLIIGSAGNFPEERKQYPAAFESVVGVAALDERGQKFARSNFGSFVDLSAPGIRIVSSGSCSDSDRQLHEGTSQAAAMVAAAAVLIKSRHPNYSAEEVKAALKNGADLLELDDPQMKAKLGAGKLNIGRALTILSSPGPGAHSSLRSQGYLLHRQGTDETVTWQIAIPERIKGFWFTRPLIQGDFHGGILHFFREDSKEGNPYVSHPLASMPEKVFVAGNRVVVQFEPSTLEKDGYWLMEYRAETIDFRSLYCSGTKNLYEEGAFTDGSGGENYSPGSDCKWQITAPEGQIVRIKFTSFDTEAKRDLIYFFNGSGTHEKIMAIFSGPNIPPELSTWSNKVLVWFVTDGRNQGQGWRAEYSFEAPSH